MYAVCYVSFLFSCVSSTIIGAAGQIWTDTQGWTCSSGSVCYQSEETTAVATCSRQNGVRNWPRYFVSLLHPLNAFMYSIW